MNRLLSVFLKKELTKVRKIIYNYEQIVTNVALPKKTLLRGEQQRLLHRSNQVT